MHSCVCSRMFVYARVSTDESDCLSVHRVLSVVLADLWCSGNVWIVCCKQCVRPTSHGAMQMTANAVTDADDATD